MTAENKILSAYLTLIAFVLACVAAWGTHVLVCIKTGNWLFLIAGAIAAPVGVVHGVGVWFGAW